MTTLDFVLRITVTRWITARIAASNYCPCTRVILILPSDKRTIQPGGKKIKAGMLKNELKVISVFSSEAKAKEAIEQLKDKERFRDFPLSCFEIDKGKMDRMSWVDGFITVRWAE